MVDSPMRSSQSVEFSLLRESEEMAKSKEKAKIGLMSGIALLIGSIIGTGIFISPRGVLLGTGKLT